MFKITDVTYDTVSRKIQNLNAKKSCGFDRIPARIIKAGGKSICQNLTLIINRCINECKFPDQFKHAEVTPLFKTNDSLSKINYRPVSVLTATSKIFESIMCDQMMEYFDNLLSQSLSAYRRLYSTNNVILKCLEDWRFALDKKMVVGCVAMDLSKAFDSIPHGLLIAKLNAYGVSKDACSLLHSYLSCRKQRVKLNGSFSKWAHVVRGVPQGSLMGPVLFNIYINDLLFVLEKECVVYNYADDNTLSCAHPEANIVKGTLEKACSSAITWFDSNYMKVNPDKFQFLLLHGHTSFSLNISGHTINPTQVIKLLGVHIDKNLNFNHHIEKLVSQGGKQVNVLARLSRQLDVSCKLKILNAFVLSNFNYCSLVYNECTMTEACKLERLLKRAVRYVYSDFETPYKDLLAKAGKCPLYVSRKRLLLEAVHKILHNQYPPMVPTFFVRSQVAYGLRNVNLLVQPSYNTIRYGRNSLRYKGAQLWNSMPDKLKSDDFNVFKINVMGFIEACQCKACLICKLF